MLASRLFLLCAGFVLCFATSSASLAQQAEKVAAESSPAVQAVNRERQARIEASLADLREKGIEPGNGKSLRECALCPELLLVEAPGIEPMAIGKFEVTRSQYIAFLLDTKYNQTGSCTVWVGGWFTNLSQMWQPVSHAGWATPGFEQGNDHPVVCVSWNDAQAYTRWLSQKTGKTYRLPTALEWRNAAMGARTQLAVPWTPQTTPQACGFGNVFDSVGEEKLSHGLGEAYACSDGYAHTAPVGKFAANPLGLYDVWGNVEELTQDKITLNQAFGLRDPRYEKIFVIPTRGGSFAGARNGALASGIVDSAETRKISVGMRVLRALD
jgi:formylglycine-generating enzyme required for sulfatase activity